MMALAPLQILAGSMLVIAMADDLYTGKFHNWLFISFLFIGVASQVFLGQSGGFIAGSMGIALAFVLLVPLVALKAIGAGDLKLMLVVGLISDATTVFWTVIYGLIWASVLGLAKVMVSRQWSVLFVRAGSLEAQNIKKVPFTVPLFLGWIHFLLRGGL